jgi:hypothetical protein
MRSSVPLTLGIAAIIIMAFCLMSAHHTLVRLLARVILTQFMWYSLYVELSFSGWAFSFCRLCSCTLDVFCHVNIRHKASETLRMFSTEPDASDRTHIYTTGLGPGSPLPPWTPSLAMDVECTLLFDLLMCQQTTRNATSAGACHQQRTAIS